MMIWWWEHCQQERQGRLQVKLSCLSEHVRRWWVYEFVSNKKENYSECNNFKAVGIGKHVWNLIRCVYKQYIGIGLDKALAPMVNKPLSKPAMTSFQRGMYMLRGLMEFSPCNTKYSMYG